MKNVPPKSPDRPTSAERRHQDSGRRHNPQIACERERKPSTGGSAVDYGKGRLRHAELAAVMRAPLDEVVGPHTPRIFRAKPDARSVIEPQASPFGLARRDFQIG